MAEIHGSSGLGKYDFPVVRARYELELDGAAVVGYVEIPLDEWEAMGEAERGEVVRAAAVACRTKFRWAVDAGWAKQRPKRRPRPLRREGGPLSPIIAARPSAN